MFGLKEEHINSIQSILKKYSNVEKAFIYGSRAKGNYENGSDIDLSLEGGKLDYTTLLKIESDLDNLNLPYQIDLSIYHNIKNQDLKDHITRIGQIFYEKISTF